MNANEIIDLTKSWYELGSTKIVPENITSEEFALFVGRSNQLTYKTAPREFNVSISIDPKCESAYVDLEKRHIFFGGSLLNKELYKKRFGVVEDVNYLALAVINGCIIHEALHLKHTKPNYTASYSFKDIIERHPSFSGFSSVPRQLLFNCVNIVEDIFIENRVDPKLEGFLQATSDMFFSKEDLESGIDPKTAEGVFALSVHFKNKKNRKHPIFGKLPFGVISILKSALTTSNSFGLGERVLLGFKLAEIIFGMMDKEDCDSCDGGGEKGEQQTSEQFSDSVEDIDEETEEMLESLSELVKGQSQKETKESATTQFFSDSSGTVTWPEVIEKDVVKDKHDRNVFNSSVRRIKESKDMSFVRDLVASQTINRTVGQARKRGSQLVSTRLHRIATDGKVFAKRDSQSNNRTRKEIIILIDLSGSTLYNGAFDSQMSTAKEMSKVLTESRIPHSVYAHTTIGGSIQDHPLLVHIYSYDMQESNSNLDERFSLVTRINSSANCDGAVLELIGEKFTMKKSSQYIFVLSDGQPSSGNYYGKAAENHVKEVANGLRAKGTAVVSFSTVSSVVEDNNRIYGRQFNLDASRNLNEQFKTMLGRILMR